MPGITVQIRTALFGLALGLALAAQEDAWRMSRDRGSFKIEMAVVPMRPQAGDLVRCTVTAQGTKLEPETARVELPDRTIRLALQPLQSRLGFSFLATAPGRCRIRLERCGEEFDFRIEEIERRREPNLMRALGKAWREEDWDAVRDLAPSVKTFLPKRNADETEEYRAIADEFARDAASLEPSKLRAIELRSCVRCHLKFVWGVVRDLSRFPELRDE